MARQVHCYQISDILNKIIQHPDKIHMGVALYCDALIGQGVPSIKHYIIMLRLGRISNSTLIYNNEILQYAVGVTIR